MNIVVIRIMNTIITIIKMFMYTIIAVIIIFMNMIMAKFQVDDQGCKYRRPWQLMLIIFLNLIFILMNTIVIVLMNTLIAS